MSTQEQAPESAARPAPAGFFDRAVRNIRRAWKDVAGSARVALTGAVRADLPDEDAERLASQIGACLEARGGEVSARARAADLGRTYLGLSATGRQRFLRLLAGGPFDGLFVCLRSQAKPPDTGDQFGFNAIIADDYGKATGDDLDQADFDIVAWRHLLGGYLTKFITELGDELRQHDLKLGIGAARGDIIGPPLGNWNLDWRQWLEQDLVDHLAIDQNSSRCPSLWHDLWPMHRGSGYRQNYLTGKGMPALVQHLDRDYAPALRKSRSSLYLARQWQHRDSTEESELTAHEAVSGLIFSSFRHDNPGPLARADFVA